MKSPQSLRRPSNWQDFETLCLKLWGEIWSCREIKKNGRVGQVQHGVDVYGIPEWENEYYGIQCKGKDEYTSSQFTTREIDEEIRKAKDFKPELKKLYFTTTAIKDSAIEEYVRKKNLEQKKSKLFEVHLFSWEDIVDLIDENKHTYDFYVKSQNFKSLQSVKVAFEDGESEILLKPVFKQVNTIYVYDAFKVTTLAETISLGIPNFGISNPGSFSPYLSRKENISYVSFRISIENSGKDPLEDYKLLLTFQGDVLALGDTNKSGGIAQIVSRHRIYTTFLDSENKVGKIVPFKPLLVSEDKIVSDEIFLKPSPTERIVSIEWKLLSRNYQSSGQLTLRLDPQISITRKYVEVNSLEEERTEFGEFSDVLRIDDDE